MGKLNERGKRSEEAWARRLKNQMERQLERNRDPETLERVDRERRSVAAWEAEGEKLRPDVRRPPAYEPVRGLWHPGTPSQPEEEALEGNWRIYAEMGWMPNLDKLEAPDVILGAAPVVSCQGTIHLRRPGKEDEEEEEAEPPDDMVPGTNPTSRERPMLLGTWQLEHPEGHDKNHGTFPFRARARGLTTLAPAAMKVFPSSCGTRDKQETAKDEANKRMEEGSMEEEDEDIDVTDSRLMGSGWRGGSLMPPKEWPLYQDNGDDRALDITCLQLHAGPELKLRRLNRRAKELSDLGNQKPFRRKEAMELSRAIWERRDEVMDPDAEPLVVRKGDMRIQVVFQEASEVAGTPCLGGIYLCRREGPLPPPAVEPCMDAPPRNEQLFLGSCFEIKAREVMKSCSDQLLLGPNEMSFRN